VLQCVAVCCSVLQFVTKGCSTHLQRLIQDAVAVHSVAEYCSLLQCVTECCRVLQSAAVCCVVLQHVAAHISSNSSKKQVCGSVLQCVAACYRVLQCVAACCSVV